MQIVILTDNKQAVQKMGSNRTKDHSLCPFMTSFPMQCQFQILLPKNVSECLCFLHESARSCDFHLFPGILTIQSLGLSIQLRVAVVIDCGNSFSVINIMGWGDALCKSCFSFTPGFCKRKLRHTTVTKSGCHYNILCTQTNSKEKQGLLYCSSIVEFHLNWNSEPASSLLAFWCGLNTVLPFSTWLSFFNQLLWSFVVVFCTCGCIL